MSTFVVSLLLFTLISVVIDISEKMDDFVKSNLSVYKIITLYYIGFVPHIVTLLMPIFIFISVIFFTSKMAANTEIVAIYASGVSFNRWLRPYFICGVFLAIILWLNINYLVPKANIIKNNFEAQYIDANSSYNALTRGSDNIYLKLDSNTYCGIHNFVERSYFSSYFFIYKFKNGKLFYNLRSSGFQYDTATKDWILNNVYERWLSDDQGEIVKQTDVLRRRYIFTPQDLSRDKYTKDKLNTAELKHLMVLEELRGAERVKDLKMEYYRRQVTPFIALLLVFIGAIIAGKKVRGGRGVHLALGIGISASFVLLERFSTIFATKGNFPPLLAATTPLILFIIVIIIFYKNAQK